MAENETCMGVNSAVNDPTEVSELCDLGQMINVFPPETAGRQGSNTQAPRTHPSTDSVQEKGNRGNEKHVTRKENSDR